MEQIFIFDPSSGELYLHEKLIGKLSAIEARILIALVNSSSDVLDRDLLLDTAWPNKNVTPNSLNVAVKKIRSIFFPVINEEIIITHFKKGFSWNRQYKLDVVESADIINTPLKISSESQIHEIVSHAVFQVEDIKSEDSIEKTSETESLLSKKQSFLYTLIKGSFLYYFSCFFLTLIIFLLAIFYTTQMTFTTCQSINDSDFCGYGILNSSMIPKDLPPGHYAYVNSQRNGFRYVEVK
ncbi:winged helix-turn-helix domain-containing protein [Buttiauxella ferragutiae]|uniref:winged helix-turn-helix domain-containing protein n=1 Tax=Buttiauxella ferragutiae TaxID=82989 RepID=UPI00352352F6